jgi:hypothetical protein
VAPDIQVVVGFDREEVEHLVDELAVLPRYEHPA